MRFHLQQLQLPDDKKSIDPSFYSGVYVGGADRIIGIGINVSYMTINGNLTKLYTFSGALENVRTYFAFNEDFDVGIFVATNSAPNAFPEALISAFFEVVAGASVEQANVKFNEINQVVLAAILPQFCRLSDRPEGTPTHNTKSIAGMYRNDIHLDIEISSKGLIRVGKLAPVRLLKTGKHTYQFLLYTNYDLPFVGKLVISNNDSVEMTYLCVTAKYRLIGV